MKRKAIVICAVAVAVVSALSAGMYQTSQASQIDTNISRFSVEYGVQPENIDGKLLSVNVQIKPVKLSPQKMIYLNNGNVNSSSPACTDSSGKKVAASESDGVWEIGPIPENSSYVNFNYTVKLGESSSDDTQVNGTMASDLLAFQGKYVLMLPWLDSKDIEQTEKYITNVTFKMTGNQQWNAIMPFAEVNSQEKTFQVLAPTWYDFYDISNSSYCFGSFYPLTASAEGKEITFYLDKGVKSTANPDDLNLVMAFYDYYAKAFGKGLQNYPIVLLRSGENGDTILGGVSGKTMALSLEMADADACQTMSRTIYHAFFDSMVTARNLRYQPALWLYDGLANYYVDASAQALSLQMQQKYGIVLQDDMNRKYLRYLYLSIEDPSMMSVSPDMEGKMTSIQEEFYFNTKIPLILSTMEKCAGQNAIVHYLIQQKAHRDIDIGQMMKNLLGANEPALRQYFSGASFIPNCWNLSGDTIGQQEILAELSTAENEIADFYQSLNASYTNEELRLIRKDVLENEIKGRNLSFGSQKIEDMVKEYSNTLYLLLMQNSLRANICSIKDPGALGAKEKIHSDENTQKWLSYEEKAGYQNG